MSDAGKALPKVPRGNNRVLVGGVAAVTAGLGLFWYAQTAIQGQKKTTQHPGAVPTWEYRLQQEQDKPSNSQQHSTQHSSSTSVPTGPKSLPTPSNSDEQGSKGAAASFATSVQGKATDEHQQPTEPSPQRAKETGEGEVASKHRSGPEFDQARHGSGKVENKD